MNNNQLLESLNKNDRLEIISNIFNGIEEYWVDVKGFIFATNLEVAAITGYREAEIIGKHFSLLYPKTGLFPDHYSNHFDAAFEKGTFKIRTTLVKRDKGKFHAAMSFEVVKQENERHLKITVQDRTHKATNSHELVRLKSHFNSLFHNHFIGVLNLQQSDLKIILANVKACEILNEYDFVGKYFTQYLKDEEAVDKFRATILTGASSDFEIQLIQRSSKVRWVSVSYSCFPLEEMIEVLLYDITEEKKKIEELERINTQLDQFMHHISHDLRAPIATLLGLINVSRYEVDSVDILHGYIDQMQKRAMHLDSILVDLTSIALNEKTSLAFESFDVDLEIKSILDQYVDTKGTLTIRLEVNCQSPFITDVKRLRIILRNLVSNSVKYTNPAERSPFIRIGVKIDCYKAVIEVEDNGIGIHPNHRSKIFEMFFRATDKSSGSGLGLYIVKSMIDKLDGQISISSTPDSGSLFRLVVPNNLAKS